MPLRLANRVKESTSTSGSGTITLGGANAGYQAFSAVLSSGDTTFYTIVNAPNWEVGIGTYASNTLSRSTILSSSNSNNKINLSGSSSVFIAYPSEKSVYKDQNNQVIVGSSGIILDVGTPSNTSNVLYNASGLLYYQNNPVAILPTGGSETQILQKVSSTGYDLEWINNYATEVSVYVKNTTSQTLLKGQAVYINSAQGDHPTIQLAIASGETGSSKTLGLLRQDLLNNEFGYVVTEGVLEGINTNSGQAGDPIWLSPTVSGGLLYGTANKPSAPNHMVFIGYNIRKQINNGKVYIRVQNGFELNELHNVAINGTQNGAFLQYNGASGLWVASNSGTFTNLTVSGAISATSGVFTSGIQIVPSVPNNTTNVLYNNSGNLYFNGSSVGNGNVKQYENISSNTVLSNAVDIVFVDSTSSEINLYMPIASGFGGKEIKIKRIAGNNSVIINASGSESIDGLSTITMHHLYQSFTLSSNNLNWFIT